MIRQLITLYIIIALTLSSSGETPSEIHARVYKEYSLRLKQGEYVHPALEASAAYIEAMNALRNTPIATTKLDAEIKYYKLHPSKCPWCKYSNRNCLTH